MNGCCCWNHYIVGLRIISPKFINQCMHWNSHHDIALALNIFLCTYIYIVYPKVKKLWAWHFCVVCWGFERIKWINIYMNVCVFTAAQIIRLVVWVKIVFPDQFLTFHIQEYSFEGAYTHSYPFGILYVNGVSCVFAVSFACYVSSISTAAVSRALLFCEWVGDIEGAM